TSYCPDRVKPRFADSEPNNRCGFGPWRTGSDEDTAANRAFDATVDDGSGIGVAIELIRHGANGRLRRERETLRREDEESTSGLIQHANRVAVQCEHGLR